MKKVLFALVLLMISLQSWAQNKVSGTVIDSESGESLIGVTVLLKGTTSGTITDFDGRYSLSVSESVTNPELVFSYVGFITQTVLVGSQSTIDVALEPDNELLEEVVVIGYGNQKRADVTYAIESIGAKSIESKAVTSFDQALQGEVAGVNVTQATGAPGGGVSVQIRGVQTITAGSEPLYVIDGFPIALNDDGLGANPLNTLNPADIESIDILKDAASTAVYGSRGANGVILITTKKGKSGEAKIQFSMYEGVQTLANKIEMMNADQFMEFQREARNNFYTMQDDTHSATDDNFDRFVNSGNSAMLIEEGLYDNYPGGGAGTDWYDEIFRSAQIRSYQVSALGGSENVNYLLSGGYFRQEGIVKGTDFERFSLRANVDSKVSDNIKVGISVAPSLALRQSQNTAGNFASGGLINAASVMAPIYPVFDTLGNYFSPRVPGPDRFFTNFVVDGNAVNNTRPAMPSVENPYRWLTTRNDEFESFRLLSNLYAEIKFLKNFKFRSSIGTNLIYGKGRTFQFTFSRYPELDNFDLPQGTLFNASEYNWLAENSLTYDLNLNDVHRLNFLLNYSVQKERGEFYFTNARNYPNELTDYINSNIAGLTTVSPGVAEWALISQLARIQYVFNDKYLFTLGIRRDGSSRFGPANRYGVFRSISAGWRFTEEDFFPKNDIVTDGKFRVSYGEVGNFNIGNFDWIGEVENVLYPLGGDNIANPVVSGQRQSTQGNSGLTWETSKQFNVGLDIGLLNNRITSALDYYIIDTEDLLLNANLPLSSGYLSSIRNVGTVRNNGFEFSVSSKNLVNELKWNTDFNISFNKNEVIALTSEGDQIIDGVDGINITKAGSPIGSFFMIPTDGIYMTQEEADADPVTNQGASPYAGARKYIDTNEDGVIDDNDRVIVGNPMPDFTFGLINTFEYKNFDLRIQIFGSIGAEIVNRGLQVSENGQGFHNNTQRYWENRFISEDQPGDGNTPKAVATTRLWNNQLTGSYMVEDASFVRVRNIVLGYRLPANVMERLAMSSARVYASVQNLLTITGYTGFDPEVSSEGTRVVSRGIDFGAYPIPRTFTVGVDINF